MVIFVSDEKTVYGFTDLPLNQIKSFEDFADNDFVVRYPRNIVDSMLKEKREHVQKVADEYDRYITTTIVEKEFDHSDLDDADLYEFDLRKLDEIPNKSVEELVAQKSSCRNSQLRGTSSFCVCVPESNKLYRFNTSIGPRINRDEEVEYLYYPAEAEVISHDRENHIYVMSSENYMEYEAYYINYINTHLGYVLAARIYERDFECELGGVTPTKEDFYEDMKEKFNSKK